MLSPAEVLRSYEDLNFWNHIDISDKENNDTQFIQTHFWELPPDIICQMAIDYNSQIINEWESGNYLTDKIPLLGFRTIPPSETACYKKPILFLVNEKSLASADLVALILQDNKRAKIMGRTTAGAGGIQNSHTYPSNQFGIDHISLPSSIIYRSHQTQVLMENQGVKPDVAYPRKLDDLKGNNKFYKDAILTQLKQLPLESKKR